MRIRHRQFPLSGFSVISLQSAAKPVELPALTGLRFVMALWVILFHFQIWMTALQVTHALPVPGTHVPLLRHGFLGVDFFFILSGFILSHVYGARFAAWEPGLWRHFIWLRFAQIWPAYIVALAVIGGLKFATFQLYGTEVARVRPTHGASNSSSMP